METNIRLTNDMRNDIRTKALAHAFSARKKELEQQLVVIGDELYAHVYGAQEKTARILGTAWVAYDDHVVITMRDWNRHRANIPMSVDRPVPSSTYEQPAIDIEKEHPFWSKLMAWQKKSFKLESEKDELSSKMRGLLWSVQTVKRLREAWPEGIQFIPAIAPVYAIVPATLTHDINRMLGLEPKPTPARKAIDKAMSK